MSRAVVIAWLRAGYSVKTIYRSAADTWDDGASVEVVVRDSYPYIRTDADNKKEDNLGKLPKF
jgi:hypothetical protein